MREPALEVPRAFTRRRLPSEGAIADARLDTLVSWGAVTVLAARCSRRNDRLPDTPGHC
jgi:hypothetical protein